MLPATNNEQISVVTTEATPGKDNIKEDAVVKKECTDDESTQSRNKPSSRRSSTSQPHSQPTTAIPFPWKLHRILDDADAKGFNDVVSWVPSNNGFKVHKTKAFDEEIMPKYFDKTKYKSFQRQLNMWGFDRVGSGPYKGAYLHACFIRGKPELCESMQRTKIKGIHSKKLRKNMLTNLDLSNHSLGGESYELSLGGDSYHMPLGGGSNHSLGGSLGGSNHSLGSYGSYGSYGSFGGDGMGMSNTNYRRASRNSSCLPPAGPSNNIQASIKAAARKVADLERQKEEIQRKLEMVSTKANAVAVSNALDNMTAPSSMSTRMITPHGSIHSREAESSESSGLDCFQPLPLREGDSLFFGGRNFFFVEDGKTFEQAPQQQQPQRRRRAARRYSLVPKSPDSDEYVLKELDQLMEGSNSSMSSHNNSDFDSQLEEDFKHALGKLCTNNEDASASFEDDMETDLMSPTPLPPNIDVVKATTNITNQNSSLVIGFDKPSRRFSFLSTPVHDPFKKTYQIQPMPSSVSRQGMNAPNANMKMANNMNNNMMNMNLMTNNMMNMNMNGNNQSNNRINNMNDDRRNSLANLLKIPSRPSFGSA